MTTLTRTKEFIISETGKKVLAITGFIAIELLIVYGLVPIVIYFWRLLTCPC
jgi:hypothetical protein